MAVAVLNPLNDGDPDEPGFHLPKPLGDEVPLALAVLKDVNDFGLVVD